MAYAKANPGKLSYGATVNGTSPHLLMEEVAHKTGMQLLHVPLKGNADFKKAIDDPENQAMLKQLDQVYWYRSSGDYAKWAAEQFVAERATIERMGLLAK